MGMEMKLEMSQKAEQRLDQKMEHSAKLEQRIAIAQELSLEARQIFEGGPDAPDKTLGTTVDRALGAIDSPGAKQMLELYHGLPDFSAFLVKRTTDLAKGSKASREEVGLRYFYELQEGKFFPEDEDAKRRKVKLHELIEAWQRRAKVLEEIEESKRLMRENKSAVGEAMLDNIRIMHESVMIADALRGQVEGLSGILATILQLEDPMTGQTVNECTRELLVLQRFVPTVSTHVVDRLRRLVEKMPERQTAESFQNAFLNSLGEYTLVSMGVLSPQLFQRAYLDPAVVEDTMKGFVEDGLDRAAMERLFDGFGKKGIYWHRWNTKTVSPGAVTDIMIREFITDRVRVDKKTLLDASQYAAFFEKIKAWRGEYRAAPAEERDALVTDLHVIIGKTFTDEGCLKAITKLASTTWYNELDVFFGKGQKK